MRRANGRQARTFPSALAYGEASTPAERSRKEPRAWPSSPREWGRGGVGNRCGLQQPNTPPSPPVSERASRPRVSKMIPWTPNDFLVTTIFTLESLVTDAQSSEGSLRHSRFTLDLSGDVTGHRCCVCLQSAQLLTSRGNFPTTTQTFQMDSDSTRWRPDYRFCKSANGPMLFWLLLNLQLKRCFLILRMDILEGVSGWQRLGVNPNSFQSHKNGKCGKNCRKQKRPRSQM